MAGALALVVTGIWTSIGVVSHAPATAGPVPNTVAGIQSLYASDLVARINAERAARSSIPQLSVDPGLAADAQAWSAHLAATGTVQDPSLPSCTGPATQVCVFAANSGSTGYGYWPGDGSDGMNAAYMASTYHRQNELGAAYNEVGVGVTCAGNQAWTVELFGYQYGDIPSALGRQSSQNSVQGDPVPATPVVAGTATGDPVYCPGQTIGPNGATTATGGQYPYPYAVAPVPGEPNGAALAPGVGMAATPDGGGYWLARADGKVSTHGDAVNYGSWPAHRSTRPSPTSSPPLTARATGWWPQTAASSPSGTPHFYGSMGGKHLNAPVVDIAPTADGGGYWLVASDGGVFTFGDAIFHGSMGGTHLNKPVVGIAATGNSSGYWMVATDGGIFSFGAPFLGSTGQYAPQPADRWHGRHPERCRLLVRGLRRRHLLLRQRHLRRLDGGHTTQRPGDRHGGRPDRQRLLDGRGRRRHLQLRGSRLLRGGLTDPRKRRPAGQLAQMIDCISE